MAIVYATGSPDRFTNLPFGTIVSYQNAPSGVSVFTSGGGAPSGWAVGDTYDQNITGVIGTPFADYISGNGRNNFLYGGDGNDGLYGFAGVGSTTYLYGENGDDALIGGAGIDIMDGGPGEDTISYLLSPTGLTISLADQRANTGWAAGDVYISIQDVIGSEFDDVIFGSREGVLNQLQGQGGNDRIFGGAGYNVLIGGAGADELHASGTGNLIDYETALSGVVASMENPSINTGDAAGDTYFNLGGADLAGSPFDDVLIGDAGNNNIIGDPDLGVYGRWGNDYLYGGGGSDTLQGDGGSDYLDGGAGFDYASYANSTIGIVASLSDPRANSGDAAGDTYFSVEGIIGSNFDDVLIGDVGDNILFGGAGNDALFGADGNDLFSGGPGADRYDGGAGFDTVAYEDATAGITVSLANPGLNTGLAAGDTFLSIEGILGTRFADVLYGDQSANGIQGGDGNDTIFGGGGSDILLGGNGDDLIFASGPNASLTGGAGADTFVFLSVTDSIASPTVAPTAITDFVSGVDRIDISAINPTSVAIVQENGFYTLQAAAAGGLLSVRSTNAFTLQDVVTFTAGQLIQGTPGYDVLVGTAGADVILGLGTGDYLKGGAGSDTFLYRASSDSLPSSYDYLADFQTGVDKIDFREINTSSISLVRSGSATFVFAETSTGPMTIAVEGTFNATDLIYQGRHGIYLVGDAADNTLIGSHLNDPIQGGAGNDLIIGGGGGDALFGEGGADTFRYLSVSDSSPTSGADSLFGFETGIDKIDLTALNTIAVSLIREGGSTFLFADTPTGPIQISSVYADVNASDVLTAAGHGFFLVGDGTNNRLVGSNAGDVILGGAGDDVIQGGLGADSVFGGAGADTFRFTSIDDSRSGSGVYDSIFDFQSGVDKLDLRPLHTSPGDTFAFLPVDGSTYVFAQFSTGAMAILLNGTPSITNADILF